MTDRYSHIGKPNLVVSALCLVVLVLCLGAVGEQGRRRAKEMVCLANLQQWGTMFQSYTDDHGGKFNPGWDVGETELWMNALRPYYGDRWPLLLCPTATKLSNAGAGWGTCTAWGRNVNLPEGGARVYTSSYGINSWTNAMTRSRGSRLEEWFWKTPEGVDAPSRVPVFGDATWHDAWPRAADEPISFSTDAGGGNTGVFGEMNHFCIDRHGGGVNLLFMDWAVRKVGLKELWALKWHRSYDTEGPWTTAGGVVATDWPQWMREFKDYEQD